MKALNLLILASLITFLCTCKKEDNTISGNTAPNYYGVPTIKVKNYVNRLFIDLSGREPLDSEMDSVVSLLEANNLDFPTREAVVKSLQFDTNPQPNGDNFNQLFYLNLYGLQKARFLEGVPDDGIKQEKNTLESQARADSLIGDVLGYNWKKQQAMIYGDILSSDTALRNGSITFNEMCRRMCYNPIYDIINMNSFNYVNAVFDNNLYRFPTTQEFTSAYNMVESDLADIVLGQPGGSKYDFSKIITSSLEFNNGTVTWIYRSFLSRFPTTSELFNYSLHYETNGDIAYLIREVMKTDEYANF
ncbi:MAG: hypothetical protein ABF242_07580 [Flavobacteriales bacterium]